MAVPQFSAVSAPSTSSTVKQQQQQQQQQYPMSSNHYTSSPPRSEESHPLFQKLDSFSVVREARAWSKVHLQHIRPWSDFMDRHRISKPASLQEAVTRINHNIIQFKVNYAVVALGLVVYIMITDLWLLLSVALLAGALSKVSSMPPDQPVRILEQSYSQTQLYGVILVVALIAFYVTSAGSAIFWVLGVSGVIIFTHAAFLEKSLESDFAQTV